MLSLASLVLLSSQHGGRDQHDRVLGVEEVVHTGEHVFFFVVSKTAFMPLVVPFGTDGSTAFEWPLNDPGPGLGFARNRKAALTFSPGMAVAGRDAYGDFLKKVHDIISFFSRDVQTLGALLVHALQDICYADNGTT